MKKLTIALLFGAVTYFSAQTAPKYVGTIEGIKEYSLNNGMQVLLLPDQSQSNMVVNIRFVMHKKFRHEKERTL